MRAVQLAGLGLLAALLAATGLVVVLEDEGASDTGAAAVSEAPQRGSSPLPTSPFPTSSAGLAQPPLTLEPALGGNDPVPTTAGLSRALAGALADPALGGRVSVAVLDVATGEVLYDEGGPRFVLPASSAKIVTGVAALTILGPRARLHTQVVSGRAPGQIVLVGGGDPTLTTPDATATRAADPPATRDDYPQLASLADLARQVAAADLAPVHTVLVDDTLFTGPTTASSWKPTYVSEGDVAPVTALSIDGGRLRPGEPARAEDPPLAAGRAFAAALRAAGVDGDLTVRRGTAPPDAAPIAQVSSPDMSSLVALMLTTSNNDLAEALARHVALAAGYEGSFAGVARALPEVASDLGIDPAAVDLVDGSGLSRADRVQPLAIARLLALAADPARPGLRPVAVGLPVAGLTGTLAQRYDAPPAGAAAGQVRAKTGTLAGVSVLAGLVVDDDGRLLAFDITADAVPVGGIPRAEAALDRFAAVLADCGCR